MTLTATAEQAQQEVGRPGSYLAWALMFGVGSALIARYFLLSEALESGYTEGFTDPSGRVSYEVLGLTVASERPEIMRELVDGARTTGFLGLFVAALGAGGAWHRFSTGPKN